MAESTEGTEGTEGGFTLIEMMVVTMVMAITFAMIMTTLISVQNAVNGDINRNNGQDQARIGLQQLTSEIRSANYLYNPANEYYSATQNYAGPVCSTTGQTSCIPVPATGVGGGFSLRVYTQTSGVYQCAQWRVWQSSSTSQSLQYRSWSPTWASDGEVTAWQTVSTYLVNPTSTPPFVQDTGSSYNDTNSAGTTYYRLIDIDLIVNAAPKVGTSSVPNATLQASLTGRNVEYGYSSQICGSSASSIPSP